MNSKNKFNHQTFLKYAFQISILLLSSLWSITITFIDEETKKPIKGLSVVYYLKDDPQQNIKQIETNNQGNITLDTVGTMILSFFNKQYFGEKTIDLNKENITIEVESKKKELKKLKETSAKKTIRIPLGGRAFDSKLLNETVQFSGFSDVLSTVKKLPGVAFSPQYTSGQLFIQGGDGTDWTAKFNGVYITDPLVWGRIISMFNPLYTNSLILYTSVLPETYPNALSGAMDITVKKFENNWSGLFDFNVTSISFYTGGYINKKQDANIFIYLRRSLLEIVIPFAEPETNKTQEYPNSWDGGIIFNHKISNSWSMEQLNWFVVSGIKNITDDSEEEQKIFKIVPGYKPKGKKLENKEYKGIHSLQFKHDLNAESKLNIVGSIIPNYTLLTVSDNGIFKTNQTFLLLENQLIINSDLVINNHILTPGIITSYYYYNYSIDDYGTSIDNTGTFIQSSNKNTKTEHRGYMAPYFNADLLLIDDILRLNIGANLVYNTSNQDVFFNPNFKLSYSPLPLKKLYIGVGLYNRTDQKLYSKLKSQKVVHNVIGMNFSYPKIRFSLEGFYKYFWDLPIKQSYKRFFSDIDRSDKYDSVGKKHAFGIGTNINLFDQKRSIISGEISYTWQRAYRKDSPSSRRNTNTLNLNFTPLPPVNKLYKDSHIREHALTFSIKIKPFVRIKIKPKYNKPSFYALFHNYISLSSYFITGETGPKPIGIKNLSGIDTIVYDRFDGDISPAIYRLDIQWTFPVLGPDIEISLLVQNVTNTRVIRNGYSISNGDIVSSDQEDFLGIIGGFGFKIAIPFRQFNP